MQCAVTIQQELKARNAELPPHRRMEFRIGINLGDVVVDGERIYGDGVNIAARLESLADGGGICISGTVYEQVKTKLALVYEDLGRKPSRTSPSRCACIGCRWNLGAFPSMSARIRCKALKEVAYCMVP